MNVCRTNVIFIHFILFLAVLYFENKLPRRSVCRHNRPIDHLRMNLYAKAVYTAHEWAAAIAIQDNSIIEWKKWAHTHRATYRDTRAQHTNMHAPANETNGQSQSFVFVFTINIWVMFCFIFRAAAHCVWLALCVCGHWRRLREIYNETTNQFRWFIYLACGNHAVLSLSRSQWICLQLCYWLKWWTRAPRQSSNRNTCSWRWSNYKCFDCVCLL